MKLQNLKGTTDFLPSQQIIRNKIIDTLKKNFEKYGYLPIKTPILNKFDLLAYKYSEDAEILNEVYHLSDQADRDLGLRYDLTIPFCKVIGLNKDLSMPFRRYEIGKVFRNGPVKAGRAREFYQCDVDVVGINGRYIEIEQLLMVESIFKQLDIDIEIKWNNRKLMTGLLKYLNIKDDLIDKVISLIDRIEKTTYQELLKEFNKIGITNMDEILELFNKSLNDYQRLFLNTDIEILRHGIDECLELQSYIDSLNLNDKIVFYPKLARGLGIYTGVVYEFFDKQKRITSSLGGGGRYDKIITDFMNNGQEYPAVGLSFGLEPIYEILKSNEEKNNLIDVLIIPMETEMECLKIATKLRNSGINTLIEMNNRKMKKSFAYADKNNIKYVIVVGSNEVENNLYTLKDMETGDQSMDSIEQIIKKIIG